ncbi:hypothetical protein NA57DRAFT_32330 [Rhizodiscina lignyota]|uniref:Atg28p n=1 Tax=Rhizodiscina lignyota TaxID=1504668 RepID=A0A9P4IME6_9PEZI|nr:hypothetical protein NA57DRAFT_32330 [Rhizodiscina lignyota]
MFPPVPVASGVRASTLRLEQASSTDDELLALRRREEYLQGKLQALLDAQADALVAGLTGGENGGVLEDDELRSGSSTPTVQSVQRGSRSKSPNINNNREQGRNVGLRTARRGIWQTIRQLSVVKNEQDGYLGADQQEDERILEQIDMWERKRTGLQRKMSEIEEQEGSEDVTTLQRDADTLGGEIEELEIRLAQMKTRHRQMLEEIADIENAVQSKLSSYSNSLSMLERDIQSFLKTAPEREDQNASRTSPFLMLPPKRRTLSMAKEYWQDKLTDVERARNDAQVEKDALDEGAIVWKEVVNTVTDFEASLKEEMVGLVKENDKEKLEQRTADLGRRLDETLQGIEERFRMAEEKDWKLLICCIGAELEAFKQGKEILESLLAPQGQEGNGHTVVPGPSSPGPLKTSARGSPRIKSKISSPPAKIALPANDSDDDPDPELLISHQ